MFGRTAIFSGLLAAGAVAAPAPGVTQAPPQIIQDPTHDQAQEMLARHARAGTITLVNIGPDASWRLERPITGIISARRCFTDFAAPRATVATNFRNPANHMGIGWSDVTHIGLSGNSVVFSANWMAPGEKAHLAATDNVKLVEVAVAALALVKHCKPPQAPRESSADFMRRYRMDQAARAHITVLGRDYRITKASSVATEEFSYAYSLRFDGRRGEKIRVTVRAEGSSPPMLFGAPEHVLDGDKARQVGTYYDSQDFRTLRVSSKTFELPKDGVYFYRIYRSAFRIQDMRQIPEDPEPYTIRVDRL